MLFVMSQILVGMCGAKFRCCNISSRNSFQLHCCAKCPGWLLDIGRGPCVLGFSDILSGIIVGTNCRWRISVNINSNIGPVTVALGLDIGLNCDKRYRNRWFKGINIVCAKTAFVVVFFGGGTGAVMGMLEARQCWRRLSHSVWSLDSILAKIILAPSYWYDSKAASSFVHSTWNWWSLRVKGVWVLENGDLVGVIVEECKAACRYVRDDASEDVEDVDVTCPGSRTGNAAAL